MTMPLVPWRLTLLTDDGTQIPVMPDHIPALPGAVAECRRMRFTLTGGRFDPFAVVLLVNDETLVRQVDRDGDGYLVTWIWETEYEAGSASVELCNVDGGPYRQEVVVDPDAAKLNRDAYHLMLLDILSDTAALAARSGCRIDVARGGTHIGIASIELIRTRLRRIEQSVSAIDRNPWRDIARVPQRTPLGRAGSISPRSLQEMHRDAVPVHPATANHLSPAMRSLAGRLHNRLPGTVQCAVPEVRHQRREHADILSALHTLSSFLVTTIDAIDAIPEQNRSREQARIAQLARHLDRRIRRLTALGLFDGVLPTRGPIRPSHLFQHVPSYRMFFKAWREARDGLADILGEFLSIPVRRTFDLYELWCFLRLAHAASLIAPGTAPWEEVFREQVSRDRLVLQLERRVLDFGTFRLVYQPLYTEIWRQREASHGSYSRVMQPDIAVEEAREPGQEPTPIIILDAKYRVEQSINDAITAAHVYRDALVYSSGPPFTDRRQVVRIAMILVPRIPVEFHRHSDWQESRAPDVFFRDEYQRTFDFGAVVLAPGVAIEEVIEVLRGLRLRASAISS